MASKKLPVPITKEEFMKILEAAKEERQKYFKPRKKEYTPYGQSINQYIVAMCLGMGAGMRISEIVGLQNKDGSYKIKPLELSQIESSHIRVVGGKGGKDRQVPLPARLLQKANITRSQFHDMLPLTIKRRALQIYLAKISKHAIKKHVNFHQLRHSFATEYLKQYPDDIRTLQVLLGHSRLDVTAVYTYVDPTKAIERAGGIDW